MNSSDILSLPYAYIISFWDKKPNGETKKKYDGFKCNWSLSHAELRLKALKDKGVDVIGVQRQIPLDGSGFVVVDIDAVMEYDKMVDLCPLLRDTLFVRGNTKGGHFYFQTDWKGKQDYIDCLEGIQGDIITNQIFELEGKKWSEHSIKKISVSDLQSIVSAKHKGIFDDSETDEEVVSVASTETKQTIPFTDFERSILDNIDAKDYSSYMDWIKFIWAIRFSYFHNAIDIADEYSQRVPGYQSRDDVETKMMDSRHEKIGWGYLMNLSKKSNPQVHSEIVKKNKLKCKKQEAQDLDEENTRIFNELAAEFEKSHCKIIDNGVYIRDEDNEITLISEKVLIQCYKHMKAGSSSNGSPISFINRWVHSNDSIRHKKKMGIFPAKCPENTYNLWKPFEMELVKTWSQDDEAVSLFRHHVSILCNHQENVTDWFMKWMAHAVQHPETKNGMMPTFVSNQGAGKNTLLEVLQGILGRAKVFDSSDPSRDVYGSFNGLMKDAFLVSLSELSPKDLKDACGKLKALITDGSISINQKGIDSYQIASYHRFVVFTNNEETIKPTKDDRRNCVIRCSDELCKKDSFGNTKSEEELEHINQHIKKIRAVLDDQNALKSIYEALKKIDVSAFIDEPPPQTEFHKNQSQLTMNPIDSFLKDFALQNQHSIDVEVSSGSLFQMFKTWASENNKGYDCTSTQFPIRLKNLKINGITNGGHTRQGNSRVLNIPLLKMRYGIIDESA
jgi:hypothetical protein